MNSARASPSERSARVILAGIERRNASRHRSRTERERLRIHHSSKTRTGCRAQLPVPGLHMVQNAMLAVAAGRAFGVSLEDCAAGLASAPLTKARLQMREINGVQFIDDSYNANPDSMKAALRTLIELDSRWKTHRRSRSNVRTRARNRSGAIAKSAKPRRRSESIT